MTTFFLPLSSTAERWTEQKLCSFRFRKSQKRQSKHRSYYINFSSSSVKVNSWNDFQIPTQLHHAVWLNRRFYLLQNLGRSREGKREKETNFSGSICIIAIFRMRVRDGVEGENRARKTGAGKKLHIIEFSVHPKTKTKMKRSSFSLISITMLHHQSENFVFGFCAINISVLEKLFNFYHVLTTPSQKRPSRKLYEQKSQMMICWRVLVVLQLPSFNAAEWSAHIFHNYLSCIINHVAKFPVEKTFESIIGRQDKSFLRLLCVNKHCRWYKTMQRVVSSHQINFESLKKTNLTKWSSLSCSQFSSLDWQCR